jgi:hypothetical protein
LICKKEWGWVWPHLSSFPDPGEAVRVRGQCCVNGKEFSLSGKTIHLETVFHPVQY